MDKNAIPSRSLSRRSKILLLIAGILIGLLATEAVSRLILGRLQQSHGPRIYDHFYFDQNEIFRIIATWTDLAVEGDKVKILHVAKS